MNQRSRLSLIVTQTLVLSLMLALFGRLFFLQVASGMKYQSAALSIQSRDIVNPAIRGAITDSSGIPLAMDRPSLQITVDRSTTDALADKGNEVFARLAKLLALKPADVYTKTRLCGELPLGQRTGCWNGTRQQPIPITKFATQDQALKVLENPTIFPGVDAAALPVRSYPTLAGENAAHVLGYTGVVTDADLANTNNHYYRNEIIGKSGLEVVYDKYLRGTPGVKTLIVDRKEAITSVAQNTSPIPGNNLVTHLDARLQSATEAALANSVKRSRSMGYHADSGAAIVMDVSNGAILAMASYPTYDPIMWQIGLTPQQAKDLFSASTGVPALSRAIQGEYAPASTFKSISIVAAKAAGYSMDALYDCPAQLKVGTQTFKNFETKSQGRINMTEAIAVSCDTIWYQIAFDQWLKDGGLNPHSPVNDYFFNAARGFGVGTKTGIDLPGELSGRLPDRQWKQNYYEANKAFFCDYTKRARPSDLTPYLIAIAHENCLDGNKLRAGDAVNFAIGQGDTLVTPLQLTQMYAAIANGGTLWKPEIAKAVLTPQGKVIKTFEPFASGKIPASASDISFLHVALRAVATRGTAAGVFANFPIEVAGKTGTGQVLGRNPNGSAKDDTSWFASFAPVASPRYAVVMMVSQGGFGASVSAVGVKDIYSALFGVVGNKVDPTKAIFPTSGPAQVIPKVDPKNAKLPTLPIIQTPAVKK
jgi:penicillin-binding protein 2